ncbi:MAG: response regulator [Cyanobacteria bacterium P01_A01_bin.37]
MASVSSFELGWEFALLATWIEQQKISQDQAKKLILATAIEVLFDIAQTTEITEHIKLNTSFSNTSTLIDVDQAIGSFHKVWRVCQRASLTKVSLNQAPLIREPEKFHNRKFAQFYNAYITLLNGKRTLRDVSVKTHQHALEITSKFLPLVHLGWVQLVDVPDLPVPTYERKPIVTGELIACVDDSIMIHQVMEKLLTSAGYQYLGIDDAMRALGILMARKPELLFLDLVMPNASGYDICKQMRKLSSFQDIPIVILTGNDGIASRIRSNFVGASDFLSKPLNAEKVLGVIHKHLKQGAA